MRRWASSIAPSTWSAGSATKRVERSARSVSNRSRSSSSLREVGFRLRHRVTGGSETGPRAAPAVCGSSGRRPPRRAAAAPRSTKYTTANTAYSMRFKRVMATAEASATLRTANPIPTVTPSPLGEPQDPAEQAMLRMGRSKYCSRQVALSGSELLVGLLSPSAAGSAAEPSVGSTGTDAGSALTASASNRVSCSLANVICPAILPYTSIVELDVAVADTVLHELGVGPSFDVQRRCTFSEVMLADAGYPKRRQRRNEVPAANVLRV